MFSVKEAKKVIAEQYSSGIKFNLEQTGNEPLPRSTNIARIAWANDGREYALFVEFFGYKNKQETSGYIYKVSDYQTWQELVAGAQQTDRTSTGVVFHSKVKAAKIPFERVW